MPYSKRQPPPLRRLTRGKVLPPVLPALARSAASASSMAISAPARFTRFVKPCWRRRAGDVSVTEPVVLGILSLIIWALIIVVTVKYVLILLRADNNGEGGTLALMALAFRALGAPRRHRRSCSASSAARCSMATP